MKKLIIVLILLSVTLLSLSAVDINNPQDPLYRDLEFWQEKGYFHHLPVLKPYPAQLLLSLLDRVSEEGSGTDRVRADYYIREIDQSLHMDFALRGEVAMGLEREERLFGGFLIGIKGAISDELVLWADIGGSLVMGQEYPYYTDYGFLSYGDRPVTDFVEDTGGFGPFDILQSLSSSIAYGKEHLYVSAGISRNSYSLGSEDSIILSSEAPQAARFELTWYEDTFSYSMLMLQLVATDALGDQANPNKYYFLHSYNWAPVNWLDVGFVESVVGSMNAVYLIPFSQLFYSQGVYGFYDNSQMGLTLRASLPADLEVNAAFFMDDISFNDYLKFNFDSKLKAAFQSGFTWSPGEKWLHRFNADYTMLTPYMYTHEQYGGPYNESRGYPTNTDDRYVNYTNYAHRGQSLGASLSPNSDRVTGEFQFRTGNMTDLHLSGTFIRHGNGSVLGSKNLADSGLDNDSNEELIHDGGIFDDGIADDDPDNGTRTFDIANRFMDQDVLEKVFKLGLGMETEVPMPLMDEKELYRMFFSLDYVYEMVWNSSRNSSYGISPVEGDDEINHYLAVAFRFMF